MVPALEEILRDTRSLVFFGGAGVSTESGIPDFRSVDGLYHQKFKYPPETMLSHTFYKTHTAEFYDFYRQKLIVHGAKPNAAHLRLAKLEREGKCKAVVTQNIDGLHQAAGSKVVYELHGSTLRNYCTHCGKFYPVSFIEEAAGQGDGVPRCTECGGAVRGRAGRGHDGERYQGNFRGRYVDRGRHQFGGVPGGGAAAVLPRGNAGGHQQTAHPGGRHGQFDFKHANRPGIG